VIGCRDLQDAPSLTASNAATAATATTAAVFSMLMLDVDSFPNII